MAVLDWMKSPAWLANIGHVMAGALVVLVMLLFTHATTPILVVESLFILYVIVKEYVIDLTLESGEDALSSTVDAVGYVGGHLAAWGLVLLAHYLG